MQTLLRILRDTIIPWTSTEGSHRIVVARPFMEAAALPPGVTLSPKPIQGKRVILKNRREHANQRLHIAEWPEANLHEIALPKLACVISGKADYLLGKYCVHCDRGNFILIPARTPHQRNGPFLADTDNSCTLLHAYAYSHGVYLWVTHSRDNQIINNFADNYLVPCTSAVTILNLMMEEAVEAKTDFEVICHHLLTIFFTTIARELSGGRYTQRSPQIRQPTAAGPHSSFTEQIQQYLASNCNKPLKLRDAADHMHMSVSQFTRRMRRETDTTFIEMLTAARIEQAKELLRETDWTFIAITSTCSFKSHSHFHTLFYQYVGMTPAQYRRKYASARQQSLPKTP